MIAIQKLFKDSQNCQETLTTTPSLTQKKFITKKKSLLRTGKPTSMYDAAGSECFSFVLAIKMSQKTDHHSKRKPPGASIAGVHVHKSHINYAIKV